MSFMNLFNFGGGSSQGGGILSGGTPSPFSDTLAGLQGGATILGMMSTLQAGRDKADAYKAQAADATINAQQALVSGQNQVTGLRQQLLSTLGQRVAAAGASGVDTGQGVTASGNTAISQNAATAGLLDRDTAEMMSKRNTIQALSDNMQANDANEAASNSAFGQLLGGALSIGKLLL